jgi:hypothetical protein
VALIAAGCGSDSSDEEQAGDSIDLTQESVLEADGDEASSTGGDDVDGEAEPTEPDAGAAAAADETTEVGEPPLDFSVGEGSD